MHGVLLSFSLFDRLPSCRSGYILSHKKHITKSNVCQQRAIVRPKKTIAKKTGWNIYIVGAIREKYANKCFTNTDPFDFIKLIRDSKFVISNSFHATAFSIIFEKNFCVVNREEGINERMKSVLNDFGLNERLVTKYDDNLLKEIDYSIFREKVQSIIEFSKEWIVNALEK